MWINYWVGIDGCFVGFWAGVERGRSWGDWGWGWRYGIIILFVYFLCMEYCICGKYCIRNILYECMDDFDGNWCSKYEVFQNN